MLRLLLIDETLNEDGVKWTELNCNAPPLFLVAPIDFSPISVNEISNDFEFFRKIRKIS